MRTLKKLYIILVLCLAATFSAFGAGDLDTQIGYVPASHPNGCVALQLVNIDSTGSHTWTFNPAVVNAATGPPAVSSITTTFGAEPLIYWTGVGDKQICYDGDCEWFHSCNCNPFPADNFGEAPLVCNSNLYCGTTSSAYGADMLSSVNPVHTGSIENNSWLQFIADSTDVTFTIDVAGTCEMQFAVYEVNGTNSAGDPSFAIYTDLSWTSTTGFSGFNVINATGLTPGTQYYIHLDGDGGAECDYEVSFISGFQTMNVAASAASVCAGDPATLTVTPNDPTATYTWTDNLGGGPYGNTGALVVNPVVNTVYTVIVTGGACSINDTLDIPVTMLGGCILPIELVKFEVNLNDNKQVELEWSTSSEINNDYFTVERSTNAFDWEKVSQVDGAGTSSNLNHYSSIDNSPYEGTSYYRLKQTDFNGDKTYSEIRTIRNVPNFEDVTIYPNPVKGTGFIRLFSNKESLTTVVIYDISGRVVSSKQYLIVEGENDFKIETDNLNQGMYFLSFNHGTKENLNLKFIKD